MEPLTEDHEFPEKKLDKDADQEQRFREPLSFGMSVAGTVAAFVAGFGILPSSTSPEKVLILITVIGVSGAIIFGIGAWRSGRRFMFMAISVGLAFTCLAALSVAAQTTSSAQGTPSHLSSDTSQPASGTPTGSLGPTGSTAALAGQGSASTTTDGYMLKYRNKAFTMNGNSCQAKDFEDYYAYVLFVGQEPQVTAPFYYIDLPPSGSWDMTLDCVSSPTDIEFSDQAAIASGNPDANACDTAVNTAPLSAGIPFSELSVGEHVCMISSSADELILVTLLSVSDSSYDTSWSATVWSLPPNS
jgi:hypothetical protein